MTDTDSTPLLTFAETNDKAQPMLMGAPASIFTSILQEMGENGDAPVQKTLAKKLDKSYDGADPAGDVTTIVKVLLSGPEDRAVNASLERTGQEYLMVDPVTIEKAEKEAPKQASKRSSRPAAEPKECACGCGGMTSGGTWLPGHDAKHKSKLITRTRQELDESAADEMVERNWWTQEQRDEALWQAQDKIENADKHAEEKAARQAEKVARKAEKAEAKAAKADIERAVKAAKAEKAAAAALESDNETGAADPSA